MRVREATSEDAEAIARVQVDTWRSAYRDIISAQFLENLSYTRRREAWTRALTAHQEDNLVYVVEDDDGEVAGFVNCGSEREGNSKYTGEIYAIYLRPRHQGKGWGKKLFFRAVKGLIGVGMDSMMLWVLKENPTRGFYEAVGGVAFDEKEIEIGGAFLPEVAYGWDQLAGFLADGR